MDYLDDKFKESITSDIIMNNIGRNELFALKRNDVMIDTNTLESEKKQKRKHNK